MMTMEDFLATVRDELGLQITAEDINRSLDELPDWDSMHLLWLLTVLERRTGYPISLAALLEATSLEQLYAAVEGT